MAHAGGTSSTNIITPKYDRTLKEFGILSRISVAIKHESDGATLVLGR
jgi:hypothetical protein